MGSDDPISAVKNEFKEIDARSGWTKHYLEIRMESLQNDFTTTAATKNKNKNLNRYRDVTPYDHTRIVLKKGKCDYINANLVKVDKADRKYILTQGPLQNTIGHFWLMVWEQNSKAIIMLNKFIEKNQPKCHVYFPLGNSARGEEEVMTFPDVGLEVTYISEEEVSYYTTRTFRLKDLETGESREILHFHYTTWPDFGVPQSPKAFLKFLSTVRKSGSLEAEGPSVVHCSAGIGRSGTFCLVDSYLVLAKRNGNNSVNIKDLLLEMRKYRMGLIQTPDQLRFSYLAIIKGLSRNIDFINDNDVIEKDSNKNSHGGSSSESESDEIEDDDDDEDEGPPPMPPPRGESLKFSVPPPPPPLDEDSPPNRPLPSAPSTPDTPEKDFGVTARQRQMDQSRVKTAEKVAEMKKKLESSEKWNKFKRSLFQPFNLGIGAFLIGGGAAALYFYLSKET